jgi:hypothetical protein
VRPGPPAGELAQEQGGGDGAALELELGLADVAQVGDRALQRRPVVLDQRHPPHPLPGGLGRGGELAGEVVVGGEQPRDPAAQRHRHGAGEGGDVDDDVGLQVAVGVGQPVGEHQPALGIGVQHLDGAPAVLRDDVAGSLRRTARHVLGGADQGRDAQREAQVGHGAQGPQHGGSAAHVGLHGEHAVVGLERQAAGVERDALADQDDVRAAPAVVVRLDEARRAGAALPHREDAAEALAAHGSLVQDGDLEPVEQLDRLLRQPLRRLLQRRRVHQVARDDGAADDSECGVERRLQGGRVGHDEGDLLQGRGVV